MNESESNYEELYNTESIDESILEEVETANSTESVEESQGSYQRFNIEAVTIQPVEEDTSTLAEYGFIGLGSAGALILISIGISSIIRLFRGI